jgi:hypothetical protein
MKNSLSKTISPVLVAALVFVLGAAVGESSAYLNRNVATNSQYNVSTMVASSSPLVTSSQRNQTPKKPSPAPVSTKAYVSNLTFLSPSESNYVETEPLKDRIAKGLAVTGHETYFADANKINPEFDLITSDFSVQDTFPHDLVEGTLDSVSSFSIATYDKATMKVIEVSPGMFQVTAYGNLECSPGLSSDLFIRPPKGSGLKYIHFSLGQDSFLDSEISATCRPSDEAISRRVAALSAKPNVAAALARAIAIAKTFSVKQ